MNPSVNTRPDVQQIITELKTSKDFALIKEARVARMSATRRSQRLGNQSSAAGQQAATIKQSPAVLKKFIRDVDDRREAFKILQSVQSVVAPTSGTSIPQSPYVTLDKPFLIWPTHGIELKDSQYTPYLSFGKMTLNPITASNEELAFFFLWENQEFQPAVISIYSYLVFYGSISAPSFTENNNDGTDYPTTESSPLWPPINYPPMPNPPTVYRSGLNISGYLHVYRWWDQPPTEPLAEADQNQAVGGVSGSSKIIAQGVDPRYTIFNVIQRGVTVIEVDAFFSIDSTAGPVSADFNSGDYQIMCPYVLLSVQYGQ
jgi:hypothetical protein